MLSVFLTLTIIIVLRVESATESAMGIGLKEEEENPILVVADGSNSEAAGSFVVSLREAREACNSVVDLFYNDCVYDVVSKNSKRMAHLYDDVRGDDSITVREAEKACRYVSDARSKRDCIYDLISTNDAGIVSVYNEDEGDESNDDGEGKEGRMIVGRIGLEDAKQACHGVLDAVYYDDCVFDVMVTKDTGMAFLYKDNRITSVYDSVQDEHISLKEVEAACDGVVYILKDDCVYHVMMTNNANNAAFYDFSDGSVSPEDAERACENAIDRMKESCIYDVLLTNDEAVSFHYQLTI